MLNILQGVRHSRPVQDGAQPLLRTTARARAGSGAGPHPYKKNRRSATHGKRNPYPYIRRIAKSTICSTALASKTIR